MLTALIGLSQVSYANPLPLGNTAGTNNLAVGEGSFASGTGSQAIGKNAIATGGNISPKEFNAELENFRDLVNQIEELRTQIAEQEKQGSVNQQLQDALKSQIAQYDTILERVREKQAQQVTLANRVIPIRKELVNRRNQLLELQNNFNTSFLPGKNKQETYQKFTTVIESLDWTKLSKTNGVDQLATDLKTKIETDFPNINLSNDKYKDLIEGYRNIQGNLVNAIPDFLNRVKDDFAIKTSTYNKYLTYDTYYDAINRWANSTFNYRTLNGIYYDDNLTSTELMRAFVTQKDDRVISALGDTARLVNPKPDRRAENYHLVVAKMSYENLVKELSNKPDSTFHKLKNLYGTDGKFFIDRDDNSLEFLTAPALKRSLKNYKEMPSPRDLSWQFTAVNDAIAQQTSNITEEQIVDLEEAVANFNNFRDLIDYNSDAWIFDKEEYRTYMNDNVIPFMNKVEEYTVTLRALSKNNLSEEERNTKTAKAIELRKYLNQQAKNPKSYINGFVPTDWIPEIKDQMTKSKNLWLKYEEEAKTTLKPYKENTVSSAIQDEIKKKTAEIATKAREVDDKEREIERLENQINALALTGEEKLAEDVKNDLTSKLDEAKAALAKNQQTLKEKRDELLGLNNQLDNSPLGKKGKNALAEGTNAFASGENAIAFGTDSQATGNNAIALGANSKANAESAIAIGKGAQALKEKALALGENAIANGASAIAIGDNVGVSGEKAVGIGSNAIVSGNGAMSIGSDNLVLHKNAVVIGSNITQTAENSVNLGNESATTVKLTPETAGTTQYAHAEILGEIYKFAASEPAGVVTVGAKGKERRIQNVAAGLVSETSTDAVNGSQLYAVAKAANEGKLGAVKYKTTETTTGTTKGVVEIATHLGGDEVNIQNSSGTARRLTGVSEGLAPTDAVNKQQLDSGLDTLTTAANEGKIGAVKYKTTETATGTKGTVEIATHLGGDEVNIQNSSGTARRLTGVSEGLAPTDAINKQQLDSGLDTLTTAANEGKIGVVRYTTTGVVGIANHLDGNEVNISNKSGNTRLLTGLSEGLAPTDAVNKAQLDREIGVVNNKISGVENKVGNVVSRVGDVVNRVGNVENRVGNVENKVGNVVNRVGNVENRVGGVENKVGNVVNRVGGVENRVGGVENRVGNVENRVGDVENKVGNVVNRVGDVENKVGNVVNRVGDVENKVGNVVNRVGGVENRVGDVENRVGNVVNRVGGVENRVGGVENRVGNVENRVGNVEKEVKNVKGSVSNAIAIASLPQVSVPGKRQLSVATGHTLGTTSVAVGLNGLSDNGRISYKLGTSVSQNSNFAVGAGIGFSW
ncbi:YadA-like family protein [Mannheimia pernigra]|uniref:YadA-like family protein n=1 Tax=Mannheimia pernigra TaxID=111844 RepID=UPI001EE243CC|nr:YadA-like family protein [Mannheimia pernigra]